MRLNSFYTERVLAAAETDPFVAERFIRAGFVITPTALLHPRRCQTGVGGRTGPDAWMGKWHLAPRPRPVIPNAVAGQPAVQPVDAIGRALPSCVGCRKFAPIGVVPSAISSHPCSLGHITDVGMVSEGV